MLFTSAWKPASTIILLSRTTGRVLLMRRGDSAKFMPGSYVFPGGVAAEADELLGEATRVAAVRELFEETGILPLNGRLKLAAEDKELKIVQQETAKDATAWHKLLGKDDLDLGSLIPWATWLTPTYQKRRYMTVFFVLPVEGEPPVEMCTREMSECLWVDPASAMERAYTGQNQLPPPQVYEMTRLSQVPIDRLSEFENKKVICPQQIRWGGEFVSNLLPGDHLYLEDDAYMQPARKISEKEAALRLDLPTHRLVFTPKPAWGQCRVYQHKLDKSHGFHLFNVDFSSKL